MRRSAPRKWLRGLGFVTGVRRGTGGNLDLTLERVDDESSIAITRALVTAGIGVAEVVKESESLEERFLEITADRRSRREPTEAVA